MPRCVPSAMRAPLVSPIPRFPAPFVQALVRKRRSSHKSRCWAGGRCFGMGASGGTRWWDFRATWGFAPACARGAMCVEVDAMDDVSVSGATKPRPPVSSPKSVQAYRAVCAPPHCLPIPLTKGRTRAVYQGPFCFRGVKLCFCLPETELNDRNRYLATLCLPCLALLISVFRPI